MIEATFTFLPMFALIFGFVDLGMAFFRWSTLQNAVREGARYAVTYQRSGTLGQDASIKKIVEQNALGIVKSNDSPQKIFVEYFAPTNANSPITTGGNIPGNIVEVSVKGVSIASLAPLSGSLINPLRKTAPILLSVSSADLLGGLPAGVLSIPR